MRRFYITGLAISAIVALAVAIVLTHWPVSLRRGLQPAARDSIVANEIAEAQRLGMREDRRGYATGMWGIAIDIGRFERECLAVVAIAEGGDLLTSFALTEAYGAQRTLVSAPAAPERVVAHVQWCTWLRQDIRAYIGLTRPGPAELAGRIRWVVLRGAFETVGGPTHLTRGVFADEQLAVVLDSLPRDQPSFMAHPDIEVPSDETSLSPPISVARGTSAILPPNAASYGALVEAVGHDHQLVVHPRVTTGTGATFDPEAEATRIAASRGRPLPPTHDAVCDLGGNHFRRILAAVDSRAFGSACVDVVFTRSGPFSLASVNRFDPTAWHEEAVTRVAPRIARDHVCSPGAPVVYLVPDTDQAEYSIEVFGQLAVSADAGAPEAPPVRSRRRSR